jgi:hypothetical protein
VIAMLPEKNCCTARLTHIKRRWEMTLNRYAKKKDLNQEQIVEALTKIGVDVWILDRPCDLLVGFRGKNFLLEVKDGKKPPSRRRLTADQQEFARTWRGQFSVVLSVQDAIAVVTGVK